MTALLLDLRIRLFNDSLSHSIRETAAVFRVSPATVYRFGNADLIDARWPNRPDKMLQRFLTPGPLAMIQPTSFLGLV